MTRTLLISLILFAGSVFADINVDYVSFVWDAATNSGTLGGGATKAAWDAGSPSDFFNTTNGTSVVNQTGVAVQDSGGLIHLEKTDEFGNVVSGTIAILDFVAAAYDAIDGYWVVTKINNSEITLDGSTYPGSDTTCTIIVGGTIDGLANIINSDLANATSVNCDVLIKGDETLAADVTLAGGGGTVSTILRFLGVDSSWVRIVPTRTTASGGSKANYLLDTSIMPTFDLTGGTYEFYLNVSYVQLDGLYFTGNTATWMVGSATGDRQAFTNCVFDNASTNDLAMAVRTDALSYAFNCDFICSGATGTTICLDGDGIFVVDNCRFINDSSSTSSIGFRSDTVMAINCLFDSVQGIAIKIVAVTQPNIVVNCTFWECGIDVQYPNASSIYLDSFTNNISSGNDTSVIDNLYTSKNLFAYYNRIINFDTTKYPSDVGGDVGFQDILGAGADFVSTGNKDFNLLVTSPAKNSGPFLTNRGSMSDAEAAGAGGGQPVIGGSVVR